jgi:type I restriction enzyme S subunit
MSEIDDLVAELCPAGVEHKSLGELGTLYSGLTGKSKRDFSSGNERFLSYVGVFNNISVDVDGDASVRVDAGERQNRVRYGDVLFTASSENSDEVGMSSTVTQAPVAPLYLNSFCFGFRPDEVGMLDPEFSKYLFRSHGVRQQIIRTANGVTRFNVSKERFRAVIVPVPPLEIQRRIAKILDSFTQLEAELEAELEARRRQYEYYRDALFSFEGHEGVRWALMGDVGEFIRGRRFTKDDVVRVGVGSIHYGEIYTRYGVFANRAFSHVRPELAPSLRFARTGDVVFAGVGETVEDVGKAVAWLGDDEVAIHDDCFAYRHSLNPKFVAYYAQTNAFHAEMAKYVARAKVKRVSGNSLAKLKIPIPSSQEQERIVGILDKFDALVNDISIGIPAEIAGRRRQYEHYRDRLLTFDQAAA